MKQFITKLTYFSLIGIIAILLIFASYLYFDPFKVLRHYDDYSYPYVIPNRDYISTSMFINNYKKNNYNSFVFGSSRTLAFKPNSWRKFLSVKDSPFMFDASGESIYGIYTKLKYLDSMNVEIKNALIILCRDFSFLQTGNHTGHLFVKHPATSGENNLLFQFEFFKAYTSLKFLFNFYSYKILGNYKPFMSGYIENRKITYDTLTNEFTIIDQETELTQNPTEYYSKRKELFYARMGEKTDSIQRINKKQIFMLKEIKRILEKNNTNYKVVLSPLYEQIKFNPTDLNILKNEFGNDLYDFSGKNSFTDNITNYYEISHFRPNVGDSILKIIYK
ncbi:MAG: hypothetical protein IT238_07910 [Bacteroidia bacterium]|nr:hypothetical protein [Bacteroidia bacterium]MCZ2249925.1 hypothetical protein [Bacteroidia bacterium]